MAELIHDAITQRPSCWHRATITMAGACITLAAVICSGGCRTVETVPRGEPFGGRFEKDEAGDSTTIDPPNGEAVVPDAHAHRFKPLPEPNTTFIQPVAYQQEPVEAPAVRAAEEIPIPQPADDSVLTLVRRPI